MTSRVDEGAVGSTVGGLAGKLDNTLAVLNGLVGDHLARTNNGLATKSAFVHEGREVATRRADFARAFPNAKRKVVILVHGLMCTESVFTWPDGTDYGTRLEQDFGYTALRVRYNTGRALVESGAELARLITELCGAYPNEIDEIAFIGFSMGGLVVRAACHTAVVEEMPWLRRVRRAFYCGTPHRGAPLERAGRVVTRALARVPDPYANLIADIAALRSDGLRDLGDADLRHEDRARTKSAGLSLREARHPVPLLEGIAHYLVAGALAKGERLASWFGDAIVPVPSATASACTERADLPLPQAHVKIFPGYSHLRLARDPAVYDQLRAWLGEARP